MIKKIIILMSVVACVSCNPAKTAEKQQELAIKEAEVSPEIKKLNALLSEYSIFSNVMGDAEALKTNIELNKKAFLYDLQKVFADERTIIGNEESLFFKADKKTHLSETYVPKGLVPLTKESAQKGNYVIYRNDLSLRASAEHALALMATAAKQAGVTLIVSSSYRSYDYQKIVYARNVKELGKEVADRESAAPGTSQHQLGTAADFGSITDAFADTKAGKWVLENSEKFGWSLSFPQGYEALTGYRWESWHFRYIGIEACEFQKKWFNNIQHYMLEFLYAWENTTLS